MTALRCARLNRCHRRNDRNKGYFMRKYVFLALLTLCAGVAQAASTKHKILFNRFRWPEVQVMIADEDGKNERLLAKHGDLEYSPSFSLDGKWVVFPREQKGLSDIYR